MSEEITKICSNCQFSKWHYDLYPCSSCSDHSNWIPVKDKELDNDAGKYIEGISAELDTLKVSLVQSQLAHAETANDLDMVSSDLNKALAELEALKVRIVELEKEVKVRDKALEMTIKHGVPCPPNQNHGDCNGIECFDCIRDFFMNQARARIENEVSDAN